MNNARENVYDSTSCDGCYVIVAVMFVIFNMYFVNIYLNEDYGYQDFSSSAMQSNVMFASL